MKKLKKIILVFIFSLTLFIGLAHFALAQVDLFGGQQSALGSALGLGAQDPRVTAAKIIRVALGFLGIIAIGLVLYGGFLWMTSNGDASKVERAKKLLISAGIGLLIILSAWGIATFILGSLLNATNATPVGPGPGPGFCSPACAAPTPYCCSGSCQATACSGPPCIGPGCAPISCDSDPGPSCSPAATCPTDYYCDGVCLCRPTGNVGDPCDADTSTAVCEPDQNMCAAYLKCDAASCLCDGAPVIEWLSPDSGAVGNLITIGGRYFGSTTGAVYFSDASGSSTILAQFPNTINPACVSNWSEKQIIVVVPGGAQNGPVRIVRADAQQDQTDDARGPAVDDFTVNAIVRPGLCLANPASGKFGDAFTLQGNNFSGADREVYFGNAKASTSADNVGGWTALSVNAAVPNIRAAASTVFVKVAGQSSNVLNFTVISDPNNNPLIDYLDPAEGPIGQYVTIYGRNFKNFQAGKSQVLFSNQSGFSVNADVDFPAVCQDNWWRDRYIIVKVPKVGGTLGVWQVSVTNRDSFISEPADFTITTGLAGPGLCAIIPHNGAVGQLVEAHGDRFGDNQGAGNASFYNNKSGLVSAWANQAVTSAVPAGAETGPFKISDGTNNSNSLNFTVGKCAVASDCESGEECCFSGTFDGICRVAGSCGEGTAAACTFGWTFSTTVSTTTPATCSGYSGASACLAAGSCPNSPGQCQTSNINISGACGTAYCNSSITACGGNCTYDNTSNKCQLTGATCDQTNTTLVDGQTAECRKVGTGGRWQINTNNASCPLGSFKDTNNWCTVGVPGTPATCDLCANGFVCQAGECFVDRKICPTGSSCDLIPASPTENKCIDAAPTCECCCRVDNSAADCCLGLTCEAGGCGNDPAVYGQCTGCRVELDGNVGTFNSNEQDASNAACNCKPGGATRICDILTNALGVCSDAGKLNDPCNNGGSCTAGAGCSGGLFCDTTSCTCQSIIGLPCDGNPSPACQASNSICTALDPDTRCDSDPASPTLCTCQPIPPPPPGAACIPPVSNPSCTIGLASCGSVDYQCLSEAGADCRCCCNPGDTNSAGLVCQADKTPCSGGARGLFCGCTSDNECGLSSVAGCSAIDTCCHDRPEVVAVDPAAGAVDVCRNPLLSATFNEEMDLKSISGNVIVVGDYGAEICPTGTDYLTGGVYKKYNTLGRLWFGLKKYLGRNAQAISGNFCAVKGLVKGSNNSAGKGVLTFAPSAVLDADRTYYAIIKGDDSATASTSEGVLSRFGIGLASPTTETFNNVTYHGYIWSFRTKEKTAADDGICRLQFVTIEPTSYLFRTAQNDAADDGLGNTLDSLTADSDKEFTAFAKSSKGENIVPTSAYNWDWNWLSENEAVVRLGAGTLPAVTPTGIIAEAQNKKDAKTYLKVNAKISADLINTPSTVNKIKSAKASIYLFFCENPWPPVVNPANWPWSDSAGNCTQETAACVDNNFELYYCRDKSAVGSLNDLPAILVNPVVRGTPSAPNQPLKELFFLRENLPAGANLTVTDQLDGSRVYAGWPAIGGATSYKLYYGSASKNYTEVVETTATNYLVSGLSAGKKYYFAITAISGAGKAESAISDEVTITPVDHTPPPAPLNLIASSTDRAVDLSWLLGSSPDLAGYHLYYGLTPGSYGKQITVSKKTNQATIKGLTNGTLYYFAVSAYDAAGNEATSTPVTATPN